MALRLLRFSLLCFGLALGLGVILVPESKACPFCTMQGQTLTGEINQASMVLFGTLKNARLSSNPADAEGYTDLEVESIIKDHPVLENKKILTLKRYIPQDPKKPYKYLIFCDVFEKKIDPYRGVAFDVGTDVAKYLKGAMAVKDASIPKKLEFYFQFLDSPDLEVSNDAYKEFGNSDYKDFKEMAGKLPPAKVVSWIQDPKTPNFRLGLYASMLGHCGKPEHASILKTMLDDPEKRQLGSLDGILAAYTILAPKEGWEYILGFLNDPAKDFMLRWGALRAVRFFHDYRPDLISKDKVLESLKPLLKQSDIADLAIEDLRKWKAFGLTPDILAIQNSEVFKVAIVRRSILRYALSASSEKPAAKSYVEKVEKENPDMVKDAKELLKLEDQPPAQPATAGPKK